MGMVVSFNISFLQSLTGRMTILTLLVSHIPQWPKYPTKATNFVFRLPRNESYIENDTYRAAGMDVINNIAR